MRVCVGIAIGDRAVSGLRVALGLAELELLKGVCNCIRVVRLPPSRKR
jgi:hypothetical protein